MFMVGQFGWLEELLLLLELLVLSKCVEKRVGRLSVWIGVSRRWSVSRWWIGQRSGREWMLEACKIEAELLYFCFNFSRKTTIIFKFQIAFLINRSRVSLYTQRAFDIVLHVQKSPSLKTVRCFRVEKEHRLMHCFIASPKQKRRLSVKLANNSVKINNHPLCLCLYRDLRRSGHSSSAIAVIVFFCRVCLCMKQQ